LQPDSKIKFPKIIEAMKTKNILLMAGIVLLVLIITAGFIFYPAYHFFFQKETLQPDNKLTIISGGGGNSGVLVTDSAILVIDTKMGGDAEDLYKLVKQKAGNKPVMVINTHYHGDHTKGNHWFKGSKIYIGDYDKSFLQKEVDPENMPNIFVKDSLVLDLGNETIMMYDMGQAHTYHDMIVYLKNRKTLFTGDLVFHNINPVLKRNSGADLDKWIKVLGKIQSKLEVVTVVPGHGKTGGKELLASMKQYFEDMRTAANNPGKEKEMKEKYKDWMELPMMTSPGATIDYIRGK